MKKAPSKDTEPELQAEYDFSAGVSWPRRENALVAA